jgi:predicted lipoprotein with Yx(FWY)xxD motif
MAPRLLFMLSLGLLALAALTGCGSSSSTTSTTTNAGASSNVSSQQSAAASVHIVKNPKLGPILVDAQGHTLYLFQKDMEGKSSCSGGCAAVWPPDVTTASPKAGIGVSSSKLGTFKRNNGTIQITYAGHPLYTYTPDTSPGQASGNAVNSFGGLWYAVRPNGANAPAVTSAGGSSSPSGAGTSPSSGGNYGY